VANPSLIHLHLNNYGTLQTFLLTYLKLIQHALGEGMIIY